MYGIVVSIQTKEQNVKGFTKELSSDLFFFFYFPDKWGKMKSHITEALIQKE